jgi:hypothetical protein
MSRVPENRMFPRLNVNCEISLKSPNGNGTQRAIARNISGNGLLFLAAEPPSVGDLMEIVVGPGECSIPELSAVIEVVRIENGHKWQFGDRDPPGPCYAVGARIKTMK